MIFISCKRILYLIFKVNKMKWSCFKVKMKFKTSVQWRQPHDSDKSDWFAQSWLVKITNGSECKLVLQMFTSLIIEEFEIQTAAFWLAQDGSNTKCSIV